MRIVADENLPLLDKFFADIGEIRTLPGRAIDAAAVQDADLLLVRSVTRVGPELLADARVRFVGSATAGTDHLDSAWMREHGIHFAHAPGCNAPAVADYVVSAVLHLLDWSLDALQGATVGIVGCGQTGQAVRNRCLRLGMHCRVSDPPLEAAGTADFEFHPLQEVLEADVVTFHVPLERDGDHPTWHLLDAERIGGLRPGTVLVNASRGAVVDNRALARRLAAEGDLRVALDVWEGEPELDPELLRLVDLATPHIAGYSLDGKWAGTAMLYAAACRFLGLPARNKLGQFVPEPPLRRMVFSAEAEPAWALRTAVGACYDIRRDDAGLRALLDLPPAERGAAFDALRRNYPLRRDFSALRITARKCRKPLPELLQAVGFRVK